MTNSMDDIADYAQAILIIGSNTTEQHPVFGARIRQADLSLLTGDRARFHGANMSLTNFFGARRKGMTLGFPADMSKLELTDGLAEITD